MTEILEPSLFIVTKEHRRFVEFCDACRRFRYIGLCYGAPGVGKTVSARTYANWDRLQSLQNHPGTPSPAPDIVDCRTVFYTVPVSHTPRQLEIEINTERDKLTYLLFEMATVLRGQDSLSGHDVAQLGTELILVDEADRLKTMGLEQLRAIYDSSKIGLIFIGMPGIEKRLSRYPQLYSRVGFVHQFNPLSTEEMSFILQHKWAEVGLSLDPNDFTDNEAMAAIFRITRGNFRLIHRLFTQIQRILEINQLRLITQEVVETAREGLVIGPV